MKEKKFSHNRKPSHSQVSGEFWDLRGKHNWKKQTNPRQNMPNCDYQWGNGSEAPICQQQVGSGQGDVGCIAGPWGKVWAWMP